MYPPRAFGGSPGRNFESSDTWFAYSNSGSGSPAGRVTGISGHIFVVLDIVSETAYILSFVRISSQTIVVLAFLL